ncbi:udp-glucose 6-dehydrogenase [Amylocarpus encephaloides]|uniref:UDP-glucose 6-dehydrogenase n=1 Tax=Amylocarpus encephaloides TaxID=45428 RepID=A0A9P7YGY4_9HELO|nr:udp-glucose 6-dehydrogenase [Amylocarpus encephaloides]
MEGSLLPAPALPIEAEESLLDSSTAPTSPEGSLTFSPVLKALKFQDALEGNSKGQRKTRHSKPGTRVYPLPGQCLVKNVCCIGAGYVGGPTAAMIALQNPQIMVTVVDKDPARIRKWNTKHLPIHEPGLHDIIRIVRDGSRESPFINERMHFASRNHEPLSIPARSPNLIFSTEVSRSISEADVILIAVNTPTKRRGLGAGSATDVTALEAVSREVAIHAKAGAIIVEKSTVPCRTADTIKTILHAHRPDVDFEILSNPEFLAEGTAMKDLLLPDRVIIGSSPTASGKRSAAALSSVYESWIPRSRIVTMNTWSAELSKLVANAILAQRISSINSISAICEATGADIDEVATGIGLDPRIGSKFLGAGVGFGGSCFKKDILSLTYLAESLGLPEVGDYWQQVLDINEWQRERFTRRIVRSFNGTLVGKKLTILGYAFKKDTQDTRESPSLECIKFLLEEVPSEIAIYDPCCNPATVTEELRRSIGAHVLKENGGPMEVYEDAYRACEGSHGVVIMTDADEFKTSPTPSLSKTTRETAIQDPRPFPHPEPTESEIFALQRYLSGTLAAHDPLERFVDEPECESGCVECEREGKRNDSIAFPARRLDWNRIAYHLQTPKCAFDGRGVIDRGVLEGFGVRVESIGKSVRGW